MIASFPLASPKAKAVTQVIATAFNLESLAVYKRLATYFKPYWFRMSVGMSAATLDGAMDAVMPLGIRMYLAYFIDGKPLPAWLQGFTEGGSWMLWLIPLGIVSFTLVQGLVSYLGTYLNKWVGLWVTTNLKMDLYQKLLWYEGRFYDVTSSGDVLVRFNYDVDTACSGLVDNVRGFLTRSVSILSLSVVLITISWKLATVALVVLGSMMIPLSFIRKFLRELANKSVIFLGSLQGHYTETAQGNRVVAAYNLQGYRWQKLLETLKLSNRLTLKMTQMQGWMTPILRTISGFGIGLVLLFGTALMQTGELSLTDFSAFLTSLILLYNPLKNVGNLAMQVQISFLALQRVFEMMDRVPAIQSPAQPQPLVDGLGSGIAFNNVSFEYLPNQPVLRNLNLSIAPGQTVALVGPSGGGKTTLAHLLMRLYDVNEGCITLNNTDIRHVALTDLRRHMAVVFQDNFIFNGTIRENIVLDCPDLPDDKLREALRSAFLEEFINSLPQGWDTPVGERGVALSGGQKQRVAIARALVKDAPLVLLDEATSALDNTSEAIVQQALDKLMENRTVLVIAHRLSTVRNADKIVVMHEGSIAEQGHHDELIAQGKLYYQLYQSQFKNKEAQAQPQANVGV